MLFDNYKADDITPEENQSNENNHPEEKNTTPEQSDQSINNKWFFIQFPSLEHVNSASDKQRIHSLTPFNYVV